MAPEALQTPDRIDARSDVYALGATAYFLLTGTTVFEGTLAEVMTKLLRDAPVSPSLRLGRPIAALDGGARRRDARQGAGSEARERRGDPVGARVRIGRSGVVPSRSGRVVEEPGSAHPRRTLRRGRAAAGATADARDQSGGRDSLSFVRRRWMCVTVSVADA